MQMHITTFGLEDCGHQRPFFPSQNCSPQGNLTEMLLPITRNCPVQQGFPKTL